MIPLLALLIAYLLGAIPFGYLLVKLKTGADVRAAGSGNIGATNVMRTTGRVAGFATLLLDIAKGYAAVWLTGRMTDGNTLWMSLAAIAVMAGHAYPVFLGFKGGKAVASFVGAFACLTPAALGVEIIIFVVVVALTRHISMASIVGAATFPLAAYLVARAPLEAVAASAVAGAFIIYRHSSNIQRLRKGTESVFKL
ncbi:MAG: acyl-phosphate glycerol-3-phosphate acyltransferase [Candidatus Solibacter sp.]|jgi:glycerol-3-phosphate acyltransferase PlsY|nr:acyl-phosphate glycerol-3-phosphate acyltransferase [Candidatus Solibacter sp.]